MTKITTGVAIIFMITSIGLAYFSGHKTGASVMKQTQPQKKAPAPPPAPVEKGTPIVPVQPGPPVK